MKKCTWCGKEWPDAVVACPDDFEPVVPLIPEVVPFPPESTVESTTNAMPLQNVSRKAIVGLSLLMTFAPFCWVLVVSHGHSKWIKFWPILPGMSVTTLNWLVLSRLGIRLHEAAAWASAIVITIAIPLMLTLLMLWRPRWRLPLMLAAFAASCGLSIVAYKFYLM